MGIRPGLSVVTIVVSLASIAQAATKKVEGEATKDAAREEWRQGNTAYNLGHYDEAIQRFEAAYKLVPDPAFLFNIAQSYRLSDRPEKALDRYRAFLRIAADEDPNREIASRMAEELKEQSMRTAEAKPAVLPAGAPKIEPTPPAHTAAGPAVREVETRQARVFAPDPTPATAGEESLAQSAPSPEASADRPFYKTWWFWTSAGAAVIAGTVTAVLFASRSGGGACTGTSLTCVELK